MVKFYDWNIWVSLHKGAAPRAVPCAYKSYANLHQNFSFHRKSNLSNFMTETFEFCYIRELLYHVPTSHNMPTFKLQHFSFLIMLRMKHLSFIAQRSCSTCSTMCIYSYMNHIPTCTNFCKCNLSNVTTEQKWVSL